MPGIPWYVAVGCTAVYTAGPVILKYASHGALKENHTRYLYTFSNRLVQKHNSCSQIHSWYIMVLQENYTVYDILTVHIIVHPGTLHSIYGVYVIPGI